LALLDANAGAMLSGFDQGQHPSNAQVLEQCGQAIAELDDMIPENGSLRDVVVEAGDVVVLLQLEKGEQAAHDAILAVLQLKRDFAAAAA
jgi:hypothetical protein